MPTFVPPVAEDRPVGLRGDPGWPLWRHFGGWAAGQTVWKDQGGAWHTSLYPYQGGSITTTHDGGTTTVEGPDEGLATAEHVFLGGHVYTVDSTLAAELVAAGFGANLEWAIGLDGSSGAFVSTADVAGFHPTSELDVRVEFTPADRTFLHGLAGQWGASGEFSWVFSVPAPGASGGPEYSASSNGTSNASVVRGPVETEDMRLVRQAYRMVHDLGTGDVSFAAGNRVGDPAYTPLVPTKTLIGSATSLFDTTANLQVGASHNGVRRLRGLLHAFEMRVDGALTVSWGPDNYAAATGSFLDDQGRTWTLGGTAEVT